MCVTEHFVDGPSQNVSLFLMAGVILPALCRVRDGVRADICVTPIVLIDVLRES